MSKLRDLFGSSRELHYLSTAAVWHALSRQHFYLIRESEIARPKVSCVLQMISPDSNWFLIDGEETHDPIVKHAATFQCQTANRPQSLRRPGGLVGQAIRTPITARPKAQPNNATPKYERVASKPRRPFSRQNSNHIRLGRRCDQGLLIDDC